MDFNVRLRLGCTGVSAASGPAPDLTVKAAVNPDRGPRSPCGRATGASGGYKCPRSGTEAPFFFLALPLHSFSRSSFSSFRRGYSTVSLANFGGQPPRRSSAKPAPPLRQSGATGPRVSTVRSSPPRSPPARSGSSSPFRLSWSSSSSSSSMAQPSGSWRGSYMREDDIERFVRLRRIPAGVITRPLGEEIEPRPEPDERVVFGAHLDRGLGLPASNFFRRFLDFFGLQPYHLPANAFILLSCYVAFMEGYAGLWPDVEFWSRLFYIRRRRPRPSRTCGAASIYPAGYVFPADPAVDCEEAANVISMSEQGQPDRSTLPEYNPAPTGRPAQAGATTPDGPGRGGESAVGLLGRVRHGGRLSAEDLLCIYPSAVFAAPERVHKIGHMSGRLDPTRTSKVELTKAQVARRVNNITKANMPENWDWGLPPYDRASPPELLFNRQGIEDGDTASRRRIMLIRRPAGDKPVMTICRWCRTKRPGEHNPPPSPGTGRAGGAAESCGSYPCGALRSRPHGASATPGEERAAAGPRPSWKLGPAATGWGPRRFEAAGAAIKFTQGGGSRPPPRAEPTLSRRRESTPRSSMRAPPVVIVRCGHVLSCASFCGAWPQRPGEPCAASPEGPSRELAMTRGGASGAAPPKLEPRGCAAGGDAPDTGEGIPHRSDEGGAGGKEPQENAPSRSGKGGASAPGDADSRRCGLPRGTRRHSGRWRAREAAGQQGTSSPAPWRTIIVRSARVEPITKLGWELRKAAEELIRLLWPTETLPQDLSNLIKWLETAPDRFLDWKESAARAGADMALSFVLSWYDEVNLDQLECRRADVEEGLSAENKTARLARACAIADFVDKRIFIEDPNPPSDDEEEELEEDVDVPEADPAAGSADAPPAGPDPAGV
ncbi:hypothetical protein QYE76_069998 [Lolium multiflorum]|uniref:Transposase (putative) gypsy type domain-containing protein n=1 Tax=Lolium multiflorum TaxID=4521 RepID=A0AAD8SII9_LOLMU|nr:hypothetical protein QYE76_069998 [Lolium multiflorum]